jgi:ABC-type amino acid transport substrate-binding protein
MVATLTHAARGFTRLALVPFVGVPFVGALLALGAGAAQAGDCTKATLGADPAEAPLSWWNGKELTGVAVEYAEALFRAVGVALQPVHAGPAARVLHEAERGKLDVVAGVVRNDELETLLRYPTTPFHWSKIAAFTRAHPRDRRAKEATFERWEDFQGLVGGAVHGMRFDEKFQAHADRNLKLTMNDSFELLARQLVAGRVAYALYPLHTGIAQLRALGLHDEVVFSLPSPGIRMARYVAVAKSSPCADLMPRLDQAAKRLALELNLDALFEKHLAAWEKSLPGSAKAQPPVDGPVPAAR